MYQHIIDQFIQQELLPDAYRQDISRWYLPLVAELDALRQHTAPATLLVGINGAQGTGKSTLAKLLVQLLRSRNQHAVQLSIDDFYLGKPQRAQLGQQVHPLLATRGVPSTHDVQLLLQTLQALSGAAADTDIVLPGFDKASDDTMAPAQCRKVRGPVDIIILEGWFIGAQPQAAADLQEPLNTLEQTEDKDGSWRRYVNAQLGGDYQQVFARMHKLIMLQAPGFEQVLEWRSLQEQKLRQSTRSNGGMDANQIGRFIQHFERLTRHCLQTLPPRANIVFELNQQHQVVNRTDHASAQTQ